MTLTRSAGSVVAATAAAALSLSTARLAAACVTHDVSAHLPVSCDVGCGDGNVTRSVALNTNSLVGAHQHAVPDARVIEVRVANFQFIPAHIAVRRGDTVRWINDDSSEHTSTHLSLTPMWDSGVLEPAESFDFTFAAAGTFDYYCTPHGGSMFGHVTVNALPSASRMKHSIAVPEPATAFSLLTGLLLLKRSRSARTGA